MFEHCSSTNRLYLPRNMRFSQRFIDDFSNLTNILLNEIANRCAREMDKAQHINRALAWLHRESFSLLDRTFVFNQIRRYCQLLAQRVNTQPEHASALMQLRLEYCRVVFSHEHYIVLNLPYLMSSKGLGQLMPQNEQRSPNPSLSSRSSASTGARVDSSV